MKSNNMFIFIITIALVIILGIIFLKKHYEKFSDSKINIWIINLDKDKDRLTKFRENLKLKNNNDINLIRHPAILGKNVNKNSDLYKKFISPDFKTVFNKDASIGCALSHATLYNNLYNKYKNNNSHNFFIICEDDAILGNNFSQKLNIILKELPMDWDFVYLGGNQTIGKKYSENLLVPDLSHKNFGFFGYMLSKKGIEKAVKNCKNINRPIDNFFKSKDFNYFTCNPHIIHHDYNNISNLTGKNRKDDNKIRNKILVKK